MDPQVSGFRQKFKANRFASTLVVLATLTLGILIGTVVSGGVKGKEKNPSADATPLQVPSPVQLSNQFSQIARQMEPSVVNISTESTIKNPHRGRRGMPPGEEGPGGGDEDSPFQDFFNRFFGGQGGQGGQGGPGQGLGPTICASAPSVPASSSIPRATSSPTITWSKRPIASASS